jgi:hypothetical protein
MPAADIILTHLDKVRSTGPGKWIACCPAHEDRSPSLSIRETDDGTVLLKCFAGCCAAEIVEAVGLQMIDLFPPREPGIHSRRPKAPRVSPSEILVLISHEMFVVQAAAHASFNGEITDDDLTRLSISIDRIDAAVKISRREGKL